MVLVGVLVGLFVDYQKKINMKLLKLLNDLLKQKEVVDRLYTNKELKDAWLDNDIELVNKMKEHNRRLLWKMNQLKKDDNV